MPNDKYALNPNLYEDFWTVETNERHRCYRVVALRDIGDIPKGTVGGFVENEDCLETYDFCWVGGDAVVFAGSKVMNTARVEGEVRLINTTVRDRARVSGRRHNLLDIDYLSHSTVGFDAVVDGVKAKYSNIYGRVSGSPTLLHVYVDESSSVEGKDVSLTGVNEKRPFQVFNGCSVKGPLVMEGEYVIGDKTIHNPDEYLTFPNVYDGNVVASYTLNRRNGRLYMLESGWEYVGDIEDEYLIKTLIKHDKHGYNAAVVAAMKAAFAASPEQVFS